MMSKNLPDLPLRSVRSSWRMLLPVSMAVELVTARVIAFWLGALAAAPRGLARAVGLAGFMASIIPGSVVLFSTKTGGWRRGIQLEYRGRE